MQNKYSTQTSAFNLDVIHDLNASMHIQAESKTFRNSTYTYIAVPKF